MTREQRKLIKAVNEFADEMKARLMEKHGEGYRGWDDVKDFTQDMNIHRIECAIDRQKAEGNKEVDIANLCMMHWYKEMSLDEALNKLGFTEKEEAKECKNCDSTGKISQIAGGEHSLHDCPKCGGSGSIYVQCESCLNFSKWRERQKEGGV